MNRFMNIFQFEKRKRMKGGKVALLLIAILLIGLNYLIFSNRIHKNQKIDLAPGSMAETGYVVLEQGNTYCQEIEVFDRVYYLDQIRIVLLNIQNDSRINIEIKKDGKKLRGINYSIADAVIGEWTKVPIRGVSLYPGHVYTLEFSSSHNGDNAPYLVTNAKELAPYIQEGNFSVNGEYIEAAASVEYSLFDVLRSDLKIYILIVSIFAALLCASFIFGKNVFQVYYRQICVLLCGVSLIPIFILSYFSRALGDDFANAAYTKVVVDNHGSLIDFLKAVVRTDIIFYNNWQGLYTTMLLEAFQPGVFGPKYYGLGVVVIVIGIFVSLYISIYIVRKCLCGNTKGVWMWTVLLGTFFIQGLPSPLEGLYMYACVYDYMPFAFFLILNGALVLNYASTQGKEAIISVLLSAVLSFVISGGNHVTSFMNIMFLFVASIVLLYKKKYHIVFPLASAIIGFIIVIIAPGTAIRQATYEKASVVDTMVASIPEAIDFLGSMMSVQWICLIVLMMPIFVEIAQNCKEKVLKIHPGIVLLISLVFLCGMLCVPYYAMQNFGGGRLENVVKIVLDVLSFVNIAYLFAWMSQHHMAENLWNKLGTIQPGILIFVFVTGLCITGYKGESVALQASNELLDTGIAQRFAQEYDARYVLLTEEDTSEIVYCTPLPESELLRLNDIREDEEYWVNAEWASYFKRRIALIPGTERRKK